MENQEAFMLETQHVSKHYGKLEVLKDINLQVKKGEVICLIGPSGAGKSTYLRSLNQLETITGGKIFIKGHLLLHREHDHTVERIDKKTQQQLLLEMGMCFQRFNLFPHKTVLDNVMMSPIIVKHEDKEQVRQEALTLLDRVGLKSKADEYPNRLSGGQQQRVALARILSSEPEAILLDEPFSALDSYLKWNLELELADLLALFGGPVLWVSHDLDECYRNCGSVCVMENGKTGAVTGMDEMIRHPESVSAARLAGCKNFLAAVEKNGAVYLPEWGMALPVDAKGKTFTTLGIPDHAVALSDGGALRCTLCRVISGVEQDILLLRPEHCGEGTPALRVAAARGNSLRAGETVCVALDAEKLLLL